MEDCFEKLSLASYVDLLILQHPNTFRKLILYGCNQAHLNAMARGWAEKFEPYKLVDIDGIVGARTCEGYMTIDLAACSTPAERAAAIHYVQDLSRSPHATRTKHLVIVYDIHLNTNPLAFNGMPCVALIGTTNRLQALSTNLLSEAITVRVPCPPVALPSKLTALAKAALATGPCIPAARRYAHESSKLCLDPAAAYVAILEELHCDDGRAIEEAARLEHVGTSITRAVHALESFVLKAQLGDSGRTV